MPEILEIGGISEEGRNGVMRGIASCNWRPEKVLGAGGFLIEGIRRGCGRNLCAGHEKAGGL